MQLHIRKRVAEAIKAGTGHSTEVVPSPLRQLARLISGGDTVTAQLLRGLLWKYRIFVVIALLTSLGAAVFEGSTLAVFTLALEALSGAETASAYADLGIVGEGLQALQQTVTSRQLFFILVFVAVIMQVIRSGLQFGSRYAASFITSWSEGDLRRRLLRQFMTMSYAQTSQYKTGDLVSYSEQITYVGHLLFTIHSGISLLLILVTYVAILFWLAWPLTLMSVLALILLSLSLGRVISNIRHISSRFVQATVTLNEHIVEFLSGLRVIHTFSREHYAIQRTGNAIDESVRARRLALVWKGAVDPIVETTAVVGLACFLALGFWLVENEGLTTLPRLAMFVIVMFRLLPRISTLNAQVAGISNDLPYAERVANILQQDDKRYMVEGVRSFNKLANQIVFDKVSLQYSGEEKVAVSDLSFTIEKGQTIAFVGASGSGKSTIVNLLLRLYDPTVGQISADGVDLRELQLSGWRERIGVVDQDTFIFNSSIAENIRLGRLNATREEIITAAQVANAHEFIMELSDGYETVVGNRGYRLSGGQRQRIAIARAVLRDPDILIFDEATSALDSQSEQLIQVSLENLRQGRTVILIAHRLSTIILADRIYVLEAGGIIEQGTHLQLLADNDRYATMWKLQSLG